LWIFISIFFVEANAAASGTVVVEEPKPKLAKSRTMKETAKVFKIFY
jgi:hypothetical protein